MQEDVSKSFSDAMLNFLIKIRKRNPHAYLIWVHGMLLQHADRGGHEHGGGIQAHNGRCARRSLPDAESFPLPGVGARNHPGLPMHEVAAQALAEEILRLRVIRAPSSKKRARSNPDDTGRIERKAPWIGRNRRAF